MASGAPSRGACVVRYGLLPPGKEPVLRFRPLSACLFTSLGVAAVACGERAKAPASRSAIVDDLGDTIRPGAPARRIVSLSPVTTEILFALGAGGRLVGRTHWDLYPDSARRVPDLGNGIQPSVEAILGARPDLVVLYASPANRAAASQLRRSGVATLSISEDRVADFPRAVRWLADAVGERSAGARIIDTVEQSLRSVKVQARPATARTVFWHIWDSPLYTIGGGSYLDELVETAGAVNIFHDLGAASPTVTMEEIVRRNPDFVLAGPTAAATIRSSAKWQAVPAVRTGRVLVVDTALVGRPGMRMGEAARHLRALIMGNTVR